MKIIMILIIIGILIATFISIIKMHFKESMHDLFEIEARKYLTTVVIENLSLIENKDYSDNGIIDIKQLNEEIQLVLNKTNDVLKQNNFIAITSIPIGSFTKNPLLSSLGPDIKIKLKMIGDVSGSLDLKVQEYGLNNAVVEVDLKMVSTVALISPFTLDEVEIVQVYPLILKIFEGDVPYIINE